MPVYGPQQAAGKTRGTDRPAFGSVHTLLFLSKVRPFFPPYPYKRTPHMSHPEHTTPTVGLHAGAPKTIIPMKRDAQTGAPSAPPPLPQAPAKAPQAPHTAHQPYTVPRPQRKRRWALWASFVALVVIPVALAAYYWMSVAEERFVTTAGFVVRAVDEQAAPDMMGGLTGLMGATSTTSDTAIVLAFLESRGMVERVQADIALDQVWAGGSDPLHRYQGGSIEDLVDYWSKRVITTHDTTTGLVTYDVQGFDAASSLAIAQAILTHTSALVNSLSEQARADALKASEAEVARTEHRLRAATEAQRAFRDEAGALNPMGSAEASVALMGEIESNLSEVRRQRAQLDGRIDPTSSPYQRLVVEEQGLEGQLATLRASAGNDASLMARFESLDMDKQFAQQAYAGALAALEAARMRAENAQRYLAVYQDPQPAGRAVLPQRTLNTVLTALALFALWSIATLLVYHVRDKLV